MAATSDEAVATTVLADEAKEKGDEAWHLTGGAYISPGETRRFKRSRFQGDATVAGDTGACAGVTVRLLGKGRFPLITYVVINLNTIGYRVGRGKSAFGVGQCHGGQNAEGSRESSLCFWPLCSGYKIDAAGV